jgi:hypothetical protein
MSHRQEVFLVTEFMNFKIKSTHSFTCANRDRICIYVFIWMSIHMCMSIKVCFFNHTLQQCESRLIVKAHVLKNQALQRRDVRVELCVKPHVFHLV